MSEESRVEQARENLAQALVKMTTRYVLWDGARAVVEAVMELLEAVEAEKAAGAIDARTTDAELSGRIMQDLARMGI